MLILCSIFYVLTVRSTLADYLPFPLAPPPAALALLSGSCSSSIQCQGVAICMQQICECPAPLYRAVGGACQMVVYNNFQVVPAVRTSVIYGQIGLPCGPASICYGGAVCLQGTCGCGTGSVVSGSTCVGGPGPILTAPGPYPLPGPYPMPGSIFSSAPVLSAAPFVPAAPAAPMIPAPYPAMPYAPMPYGPMPIGSPVAPAGCAGGCAGGACFANVCRCPQGYIASSGRCGPLIAVTQSSPGGPCFLGEECTGGSVCVLGVCACTEGLINVGEVCVVPPPPPAPVAYPIALVAVGSPCGAALGRCGFGAVCQAGVCGCGSSFTAVGSVCYRKKK